ncbi:hypothetical protein [Euzebya sp.]|uniref:hypothetical protein n=1 Tax=Euzebya sp. TaxID=1971409 RepID=UPI003510FEF9
MSAARRRRNKGGGGSNRRKGKKKPQVGFWGDPAKLPEQRRDVRISTEPAVVPHSLGPPPLPGHETIAEHYFTAVYDKSVTLSGALAAAAGLIEPDELVDELGE